MLQLVIKIGEKVKIEGVGRIFVIEKNGRQVKLGFETDMGPITIEKQGIEPLPPVRPLLRGQ